MKYDFSTIWNRSGMDALAVDMIGKGGEGSSAPRAPKEGFSAIPMWVADMNFATAPAITEHITKRLTHPLFGYFRPRKEYIDAIIAWHRDRNGVTCMSAEDIGYENGVLGCVSSVIQAFTTAGERILLHSPTYVGFTHVLEDTGRVAEHSPLVKDENGIWRMDYSDMEERLKKHHIHLAVMCSPHNPCGRVWERWELERAMELFAKYDVTVISDEIWSDITLNGSKHTPTQMISEDAKNRTVAIYAPSKTFNLAGLIGSYHVIYNTYLRDRITRVSETSHYNDLNVLSMYALIGAYSKEGREWADEMKAVISENVNYAHDYIRDNFAGVKLMKPQGTYMLFIDCEEYCRAHGKTIHDVIEAGWDVGIGWQDGTAFFDPWAIRINLALPMPLLRDALERMKAYVFV